MQRLNRVTIYIDGEASLHVNTEAGQLVTHPAQVLGLDLMDGNFVTDSAGLKAVFTDHQTTNIGTRYHI